MFTKLKNKIAEEVKSSPSRIQQLAQVAQVKRQRMRAHTGAGRSSFVVCSIIQITQTTHLIRISHLFLNNSNWMLGFLTHSFFSRFDELGGGEFGVEYHIWIGPIEWQFFQHNWRRCVPAVSVHSNPVCNNFPLNFESQIHPRIRLIIRSQRSRRHRHQSSIICKRWIMAESHRRVSDDCPIHQWQAMYRFGCRVMNHRRPTISRPTPVTSMTVHRLRAMRPIWTR